MATASPLLLLLLLSLAALAAGYKSGPPKFICLIGQPMHFAVKGDKSTMYSPYTESQLFTLRTNATTWSAGDKIQVELLPNSADGKFEGFILRAVHAGPRANDTVAGPLIGSLECSNSHNASMKLMSVYSPTNNTNCVSHASEKDYKWLRCVWTAPMTNEGAIMFLATAVEDYDKYQQLMTAPINNTMGMLNTQPMIGDMTKLPSMYGCGKTKSCALYPSMCDTRGGCTHAVMMTVRPDSSVLFEMFGATNNWIGLGIGDSTEMEKMELFWCSYTSHGMHVQTAYSPYEAVMTVFRPAVTERKGMALFNQSSSAIPPQPTVIACSFVRPAVESYTLYTFNSKTKTDGEATMTSDLTAGKFVVLAQGATLAPQSTMPRQHAHKPLWAPMKFSTKSVQKMYFGGTSTTVKMHGTLMTIFWMFLAAFAIIIARHSRPVFNQKLVLQKDLWFLLHIIFMVSGFVVAVAGVIYLLVREGEWETDSQTHGILGLIGMGLALINIVMGIFRPDPEAKFRHIFNLLHRYNGLLSLVFATIAMWLGATFYNHRPEFRFWAIIVLGVWTGIVLVFMIVFEIARQLKARNAGFQQAVENKYTLDRLDQDGGKDEPAAEPVKGKRLRHIPSAVLLMCGACLLAVAAAFWAGLWLH